MGNGTHCKHGVHYGDVCGKCTAIYTEEELQAAITEAIEEDRAKRAAEEGKAEPRPGTVDDGRVVLTQAEFDALPDYSCSVPTGATIGKRWKRRNDYHDASKGWKMGKYVPHSEPGTVGIEWRDIDIRPVAQAPTAQSAPPPAGPTSDLKLAAEYILKGLQPDLSNEGAYIAYAEKLARAVLAPPVEPPAPRPVPMPADPNHIYWLVWAARQMVTVCSGRDADLRTCTDQAASLGALLAKYFAHIPPIVGSKAIGVAPEAQAGEAP